ncbi:hypothetical protein IKG06_00895 [Candidatus Saccharibacteria bacterium]|nr:hypothetical protein [Candidatus Saccharibacteria bacterium]
MAKKIKVFSEIILGIASILTLGLASAISPAHACEGGPIGTNCTEADTESKSDDELLIDSDAEDDTYAEADAKIESERTVEHSLFLAGNDIISKDYVKGIHFLAGNLVEYTGSVEYGAFAGYSIKVDGAVSKDLFTAGSSIELGEDTLIGRDLYAAAQTVLIKANLAGNAFIGAERLVLENVTIDGDLNVSASDIVIKGKSSVAGTFKYNDSARITGLDELSTGDIITYTAPTNEVSFGTSLTGQFVILLGRLLVTIVIVAIASKFSKRLLDEFSAKNSWKDLALGLGLLLGIPLACLFIMITVIGLPLGIIGLVCYGLFAYLSTSVTGGVVGNLVATKLFKKEGMHIFLKYTIGIVLIELMGLIPYIGSLITGLSVCFGFGYLIHKLFRQPKPNK